MCATTWVDLWFVADYRWDASSGGKVLKLQLDFVMALDDLSSFLTFKAMNIGEFSSTTIATSGEGGVLQNRRCNASLNFISERQVPLTNRNLVGFAATCLFLGF